MTTPAAHVRRSYRSLTKALVRLGYDREQAEDALVSALQRLHERGEEVTDEVIDGSQSVVVRQAGNRLHAQKGILAWMLGAKA